MTDKPEQEWHRKMRERREKIEAALAKLPPLPRGTEFWYVGRNDGYLDVGREETRDSAISVGENDCDGDGFHIVCGRIDPVDIAAHFDVESFIEGIDENGDYLSFEGMDSVFERVTRDQIDDLENRVRAAMRDWQIECHNAGNQVTGDLFTHSHSAEYIAGKGDEE